MVQELVKIAADWTGASTFGKVIDTMIEKWHPKFIVYATLALLAAAFVGCAPAFDDAIGDGDTGPTYQPINETEKDADHRSLRSLVVADRQGARQLLDDQERARFDYPDPFRQVGLRMEVADLEELEYRVADNGDMSDPQWSPWKSAPVYWSEGDLHNAHVILDTPANTIEFRGLAGLAFAEIEFFDTVTARAEPVVATPPIAAPQEGEDPDAIRTTTQAVAPASLVTSRQEWNAINPDKICGSVVAPYRMAIHHTASPSSDGSDVHATMRGMQSYHINTRGWCDIGYHFVVAQSGELLQGRSRSDRPGAHVGNNNHGNVGISLIGNYSANHPPEVQIDSAVDMVRWVHETHGVELNRSQVKGHREHSGQTTTCPGDVGLSYVDEIVERAGDTGPVEPPGDYDVDVDILVHGLDDFYTQGTSEGGPDGFAGDEFTVELRVTNNSTEPIRDVALRYAFQPTAMTAKDYRIESDYPAYNQSDWEINDANEAPENPAGAELGNSGEFVLYAFSPGETKRVVVDMEARQYSIGADDFGGVRAWVRHVRDVYEDQNEFGQEPEINWVGQRLQKAQSVDILSRAEWQFRADERQDLEGWTAQGDVEELAINTSHELLAQRVAGDNAQIISPPWTEIDAERYDELVLRVRAHDGDHHKVLHWAGGGQDFDRDRALRFESPGDGEFHTLVIPVGDHPRWSGTVERLALTMRDGPAEEGAESRWYDIDYLYFQHRGDGQTSSATLDIVDEQPLSVDFEVTTDGPQLNAPDGPIAQFHGSFPGVAPGASGEVRTHGCAATSPAMPPPIVLVLLMIIGAIAGGRRQAVA